MSASMWPTPPDDARFELTPEGHGYITGTGPGPDGSELDLDADDSPFNDDDEDLCDGNGWDDDPSEASEFDTIFERDND